MSLTVSLTSAYAGARNATETVADVARNVARIGREPAEPRREPPAEPAPALSSATQVSLTAEALDFLSERADAAAEYARMIEARAAYRSSLESAETADRLLQESIDLRDSIDLQA